WEVDPAKVIPDEGRSVLEGAIHPWQRHGPRLLREALEDVARRHNFSRGVRGRAPATGEPGRARGRPLAGRLRTASGRRGPGRLRGAGVPGAGAAGRRSPPSGDPEPAALPR